MSFAADIAKFAEKTKQAQDKVVGGVCFQLSESIILRTPVGNPDLWKKGKAPEGYTGGTARGNWIPTLNSPATEPINDEDQNGTVTINKAAGVAEGAAGKVFYLVNNLTYIRPLEYGHSETQAPKGMVRITVKQFQKALRKAVKENQ